MKTIDSQAVQHMLDQWKDIELYLQMEMTTGAYAAHMDSTKFTASTFVKNGKVRFHQGSIAGSGPYRVGLKTETGWVYSEGLTHWAEESADVLVLAGYDSEGKLIVGLQLSRQPF
ncbi:YojF family protein [Paenibacillus hodogayensis]|uniref:YojF family protein n=1 Tax=Paenibacillus hodogayensis TaxID=279208 RepID=A0ABV5VQN1_9BACL